MEVGHEQPTGESRDPHVHEAGVPRPDEAAANCADTHVRASCTRASAPCVLYVPEAQGSLPPAPHALCAYAVRVPASGVQQVVPQFPYNLSRAPTCYNMYMCM